MDTTTPHYLLFSQIDRASGTGHWRFTLRTDDGAVHADTTDTEPGLRGERLDLLTVIRALESLDQPSRVTLTNCSDYVWKGVHYGLPEWRSNGWRWEFFGQMVPVKNLDLWQRMDRALAVHRLDCRRRRFDSAHPPHLSHPMRREAESWGIRGKLSHWLEYVVSPLLYASRWLAGAAAKA
jgi:ribonuclease HI